MPCVLLIGRTWLLSVFLVALAVELKKMVIFKMAGKQNQAGAKGRDPNQSLSMWIGSNESIGLNALQSHC